MTRIVPEREILLDGCVNFRDVGGYRTAYGSMVRWRRLFRSDDLDELSARDVEVVCDHLGVRTVVDLRAGHEQRRGVPHPLHGGEVKVASVPFTTIDPPPETENGDLARRYLDLLYQGSAALCAVFDTVANSPGGVVVHCAAGKDRTGLTVAAMLGTLGVHDEDIATDYALTERNLDRIAERLRRMPAYDTWYRRVSRSNGEARHDTMLGLLALIRHRHGSVENLVRDLGVDRTAIDEVRAALLA